MKNYLILSAEWGKKEGGEGDTYSFNSLKELSSFRKEFPEKMKNNYNYVLSDGTIENGYFKVIESDSHVKIFIKKIKNTFDNLINKKALFSI